MEYQTCGIFDEKHNLYKRSFVIFFRTNLTFLTVMC